MTFVVSQFLTLMMTALRRRIVSIVCATHAVAIVFRRKLVAGVNVASIAAPPLKHNGRSVGRIGLLAVAGVRSRPRASETSAG